jgi:nucleotidyltransferase/DNA polymerase involved in DNA repair
LGIKTGADLKKYKKEQLIQIFGKSGGYFFDIAHGLDERPVEPNRIRKSIGKIIGKQGRTAQAMRTILSAASGKTRKRYILEIVE